MLMRKAVAESEHRLKVERSLLYQNSRYETLSGEGLSIKFGHLSFLFVCIAQCGSCSFCIKHAME